MPIALLSGSACWFLFLVSCFCSLLSASLFLLVLFLLLAFCSLSLLLSACCFWLCAFAFCVLFLLSAFCFLRLAFCFYVFWTESKNGCNKTIAITSASITVTLTKDSHYSNLNSILLLLILLRVLLLRVVFLLQTNEHQETTNEHRKEEKTNEHKEKNQRINAATCSIRERTRLQLV